MSKPILIQSPAQGLNSRLPANMIADRETPLSQNVLFSSGVIKTPYGFAKLTAGSLPLNSGDKILGIAPFTEKDGTEHIVVVTTDKIYQHDRVNEEWDNIVINDLTNPNNLLRANVDSPVSFAVVAHTDGVAIDAGVNNAYYHLLVCDGGLSPIQRWAGKSEEKFYSLKGADGYHDADTPLVIDHYARQVLVFYNHVILISPKTWDATAGSFRDNPQTVLWGKAGLLEGSDAFKIADTGSGYNELVDTGDSNVWAMQLGNQLIIYQRHSIWSMSHVGGTDVFRFRCELPDLGLLAPHLLVSSGNKHYFVGNDFNIYEYSGGSYKQRIGDQIRDALKEDIDFTYARRCWMAIGANSSRLWIFYVPEGQEYITKAYGVDVKTGAWMIREFSHVWTNNGITAVLTIGAQSYMIGDTYQHSINLARTYAEAIAAGTTYRDVLQEILTDETLTLGDSEGNIYQYDADLTTDDGENIPAYFISKVFDYGTPNDDKWWSGLSVVAKGTKLVVSYRIDNFDTENDGWIAFTAIDLTSNYQDYNWTDFDFSSKQIQFKFSNYAGSTFAIREFKIHAPTVEAAI